MSRLVPHEIPGEPDEENPEWADDDFRWAARSQDFGGDILKVTAFLSRRSEILRAAESLGIPRDTFLAFDPNKPGFEERVAAAFGAFPKAAGLAAE